MLVDDRFDPQHVYHYLRDVVRSLDAEIGPRCYMMLGALVRDHHLDRVLGEDRDTRRTQDFDFAVVVPDETSFQRVLKTGEPGGPGVLPVRRRISGLPVDLLPIFPAGGQVEWEKGGVEWDLRGLREAWENSEMLELGEGLSVKIPTLLAMIALKIVAWGARKDRKDAGDCGLLLRAAAEEKEPTVWDEANLEELLDSFDGDPLLIAAYLVGIDLRVLLRDDTLRSCRELLGSNGDDLWKSVESTISSYGAADLHEMDSSQKGRKQQIAAFTKGLTTDD